MINTSYVAAYLDIGYQLWDQRDSLSNINRAINNMSEHDAQVAKFCSLLLGEPFTRANWFYLARKFIAQVQDCYVSGEQVFYKLATQKFVGPARSELRLVGLACLMASEGYTIEEQPAEFINVLLPSGSWRRVNQYECSCEDSKPCDHMKFVDVYQTNRGLFLEHGVANWFNHSIKGVRVA